jgi:hypothetical protein
MNRREPHGGGNGDIAGSNTERQQGNTPNKYGKKDNMPVINPAIRPGGAKPKRGLADKVLYI